MSNAVNLPKGWTVRSDDAGRSVYDPAGELFASFGDAPDAVLESAVSRTAEAWIARNKESVRRGLAQGAWARVALEDLDSY